MSGCKRNDNAMNVTLYMPTKIVEIIDRDKGDISRNLWIRRVVLKALKEQGEILQIAAETKQ